MHTFTKKVFFALLIIAGFFFFDIKLVSYAQEATPTLTLTPTPTTESKEEKTNDLQQKIKELEDKVSGLQSQGKTLSSEIAVINNQIALTQLRIDATKHEIVELGEDIQAANGRIETLEKSLNDITEVLMNRIRATYQIGTIQPLQVLLTSGTVGDFLSRANYLRIAQANDKKLMYNTVQAKNDYKNQKELFEQKKVKVESLKKQLDDYTAQIDQEKAKKQNLLTTTRNDEAKYQSLLAAARQEYEAIQGIVAGNGSEVEKGPVSEGDRIASVISGASCNSGGTHLHFIVRSGGSTLNPFGHLSGIDSQNCSGSSCGSGDGDPFNPSGSWRWPLEGPIKLTQGYGTTWAVRNSWVGQIYNFHNGIDISGSSLDVKAVKSGTLYQGSYGGGGGCRLRYVRVQHTEGGLDTLYLHINYIL